MAHEPPLIYLYRVIAIGYTDHRPDALLPHLLHISLVTVTHLFDHFMCYKLDSSSLLCPPFEDVIQLGFQQELVD